MFSIIPHVLTLSQAATAELYRQWKVKLLYAYLSAMTWRRIGPPYLTLTLDDGEWLASRTCPFIPVERATGIDWIGGWVGI